VDTVIQKDQEWKAFFNIVWKRGPLAVRANQRGAAGCRAQKTVPFLAYPRAAISNALEIP
jgi:hypothetical protein